MKQLPDDYMHKNVNPARMSVVAHTSAPEQLSPSSLRGARDDIAFVVTFPPLQVDRIYVLNRRWP